MGMMDKAKDMKDKAAQSGKADEAIDKGAEMADEKTEGKYSDKIDEGADKAKEAMQQPNE
jgi:hypothetical protein